MSPELRALMDQKDAMEKEIVDISEALSADNLGGVSGPLVDAEGFPRADVDVHATRTLRNRLAILNTDHQRLMQQVEQALFAHHAALREGAPPLERQPSPMPPPPNSSLPRAPLPAPAATPVAPSAGPPTTPHDSNALPNGHVTLLPFAEIDEVAEGGPAAAAGIQRGDKLLRFGGLHAGNHDQLRALARLTQRSEGDVIPLLVLRTEVRRALCGRLGRASQVRGQSDLGSPRAICAGDARREG